MGIVRCPQGGRRLVGGFSEKH